MNPTEQLLADLLRVDSTEGREGALGSYLCDLLEPRGYQVRRQPVAPSGAGDGLPDRFNLILTRGEPKLFLFGHLDTVHAVGGDGAQWTCPPFDATTDGGRMVGLGAVDMKGGIAAFVAAALAVDPDHLGLCFTCDEEGKFSGVRTFLDQGGFGGALPELAVFAEPTDLRIIHRHRACFEVAIQARGRAAHAGAPHLGKDASQLFSCLAALKGELRSDFPGTDLNIGYFRSGRLDAINVVPDEAEAVIDVRPNTALHDRGIDYLVERATTLVQERGLTVSHQINIDMKPLEVEPAELAPLREAVRSVGLDEIYAALDGTSEAGEVRHRTGVPCVHFGPGPQAMSHQVDEYVELDMLLNSQRVFESLIGNMQR